LKGFWAQMGMCPLPAERGKYCIKNGPGNLNIRRSD